VGNDVLTKEEIEERIETLDDRLDPTSVEFGDPLLIAELKGLKKLLKEKYG
jgi:hypothetical protein